MEVIVKREVLVHLLQKVIGVISPKQNNPIYSHVLVEIESGAINITSSNVELQISAAVTYKGKESVSFVIPARKTMEILRNLNNDELKLEINPNDVIFSSDTYRFSLRTLDHNHFKLIQSLKNPVKLTTKAAYLREAIKSTIFVSIENSSVIYMGGIFLELTKDKLTTVTTDSFRMAMFEVPTQSDNKADQLQSLNELILPRKTAQEMQSILQGEEKEVTLEITQNEVALNAPGARLVSKLLDAKFPPYAQLLDLDCKEYLIVRKDELSKALRAISVLGDRENPKAYLSVKKDSCEVNLSRAQDSGSYKIDNSEAEIVQEFQVEFVTRYLIEAIDSLSSSQAKIEFPEARRTLIVRGVESTRDSTHVISLIH